MQSANPWSWEKQDVKEWAASTFGEQLAEAFEVNDVTGALLLTEINEEVLRESIIVESWGLRKRILMAMNQLLQQYPAETSMGTATTVPKRTSVTVTRAKALTVDEVSEFLDNYVHTDLMPRWENEKKPVLEQSSYRFWLKQRSNKAFIPDAEAKCSHILHHRIPRICEALAQSGFTNTSDLRRVSLSLEAACFDARKLMWQMNLLRGPPPKKPRESPIDALRKRPKLAPKLEESSDESISSDEGWSSFISDDGPGEDEYESDWNDFISPDEQGTIFYSAEDDSDDGDEELLAQKSDSHVSDLSKPQGDSEQEKSTTPPMTGANKRARDDNESDGSIQDSKQQSRSPSEPLANDASNGKRKLRRLRQVPDSPIYSESNDADMDAEKESDGSSTNDEVLSRPVRSARSKKDAHNGASTNAAIILSDEELEEEDDNQMTEADWRKSLSQVQLPNLTKAMAQMADAEINDLHLSLKEANKLELTASEAELLKELDFVSRLFDDTKLADDEVQEGQHTPDLTEFISNIRQFLKERSAREIRLARMMKKTQRKRRVIDSEEDQSEEEEEGKQKLDKDGDSLSEQNGKQPSGKRGFRRIRDEASTVAALHKRHREMWKEIEERAEIEVQQSDEAALNVVVNIGDVDTAKRVKLLPHLAQHLKPHQLEGIRFLWKQTMMLQTGGVLGHSMGLGKTMQIITYVHTLFSEIDAGNEHLPESVMDGRVLILAPVTTLQNWDNEFRKWIPRSERSTIRQVINYSAYKSVQGNARTAVIKRWYQRGGVLLMGYDSFRLALKHSTNADSKDNIRKWLLNPGPSVVIIDEGHKIKSNKSHIYNTVKEFHTPFRICMTGYPLQNNLEEYYCMIDFIYPGYLGTLSEFRNSYKNPIEHFYEDTSPAERHISKRQLYKLRRIIADLIHRRDASILTKELKRKIEYDICCKLTPEQYQTYTLCLEDVKGPMNIPPIQILQVLRNICNHPEAFLTQMQSSKLNENSFPSKKRSDIVSPNEPTMQTRSQSASQLTTEVTTQATAQPADRPTDQAPTASYSAGFDWGMKLGINKADKEVVSVSSSASSTPNTPFADAAIVSPQIGTAIDKIIEEDETLIPKEMVQTFRATMTYLASLPDISRAELSCKCKIMLQLVKEGIEIGDKLIISSHSIASLNCIEDILSEERVHTLRIDGSTPIVLRQDIIDKFNNQKKWNVVLVSAKAASLGINLFSANRVILFDLDWNPCHDEQAVARAYRFGQEKEVFVYRLQTYSTIEQHIFRINVHKSGISSRVVDDKTLQPQKQDSFRACYVLPDPSPTEPLAESAYANITDSVLKAAAETCKNDLVDIELHTNYTAEYLHEELNEEQKKEIEEQINLEQRIRIGEVMPSEITPSQLLEAIGKHPENIFAPMPLPTRQITASQRNETNSWRVNMVSPYRQYPAYLSGMHPASHQQGVSSPASSYTASSPSTSSMIPQQSSQVDRPSNFSYGVPPPHKTNGRLQTEYRNAVTSAYAYRHNVVPGNRDSYANGTPYFHSPQSGYLPGSPSSSQSPYWVPLRQQVNPSNADAEVVILSDTEQEEFNRPHGETEVAMQIDSAASWKAELESLKSEMDAFEQRFSHRSRTTSYHKPK